MQNSSSSVSTQQRILLFTILFLIPLGASSLRAQTAVEKPVPNAGPTEAATAPAPTPAETTQAPSNTTPASSPDQPTVNDNSVSQLPTVLVTAATRNSEPVDQTATSTTVITHDELNEYQYASVSDALSKVAGLSVVPTGTPGQVTSVFIRGTNSNQSLFTIDGRRQPTGLDGAYDFANLTLDDVDQIEVVRTPSSSLDGGNAMGGVINLVTLSGRGLDHPESSASFEGGSFDTFRENIQSRGADGNFDYAISGSHEDSDFDRFNENYRNNSYRGNFGYQLTPDIYLDLHSAYSLSNAGSPNTIETPDPVARLSTEDWNVSPEITAKVTDFYTTKFYFNRDQQRQNFNDPYSLGYSIFPSSTRQQIDTDSIDWQNQLQIAHNWLVTVGLQGDDSSVFVYDNLLGMRTIQNHLTNVGEYVQSQWQPIKNLNVLSSVRYDSYSDYQGAVSFRQGAAYRVESTQTLIHGSAASAYTPPSLQDLYYPGYSNPNLKPETSLGFEAGVEQPFLNGILTPGVTYFHNDISNLIQDDANFIPQNIGKATTEGAEIEVKAKPIDVLTLDLNYTYLTAKDDTDDIRLVRRPSNSLNFTAAWNPIKPLTFTAGGSWVVGRQDYDPTTFAQITAPDYFVMRLGAAWKVNSNLDLWVRGENVTDMNYQPVLGYPALPAAVYAGLRVSF